MRIACVLASNLPVQVEMQRPGARQPLIISHPVNGETVFAMSDDAAQAGVEIGMSVYQARQIAPTAWVVAPDEMAYHGAHGAIEAALRGFSPAVETVVLGEFLLDVRGLERNDPDEQALAEALGAAARAASGLRVQVGLAEGKFVAQQAERQAPANGACVVPAGDEARFVAPLLVSVLPHLPGEMRRRLHLFDLHTLGDLAALRKPAVLRQFGGEVSSLYELARGHDPRPLNPDVPPLRVVRSLRLASPVAQRAVLLNVTQRLGRQLSQALQEHGYHAEAIKLALVDEKGGRVEAGLSLKPPTSDETRLCRVAALLLGRVKVTVPIEAVALSSYPLRSWHLGAHQRSLVEAGVSTQRTRLEESLQLIAHRFGEAVVRIAALLGPPVPFRIQVSLNTRGQPARLTYGGLTRVVLEIDETWREERLWWNRPVRRDFFRVQLGDGSLRNLFQDLVTGDWYLDRSWPLL